MNTEIKNNSIPSSTIMQFVRESRGPMKGQPRGIVIASIVDGKISIGWSYTKITAGDRFDKKRGIEIAVNRLATGTNREIPIAVLPVVNKMTVRAKAYFKTSEIM